MKSFSLLGLLACVGALLLLAGPAASQPGPDAVPSDGIDGGFEVPGGFPPLNDNVIESRDVVVAVSKSGRTVYGYSDATGQWAKVNVDNAEKRITPLVGGDLAAFVAGNKAYAFSAESGEWGVVEVGSATEVDQPITPIIGADVVAFVSGTKAYAFGAQSGKWGVADLGAEGTPVVGLRVRVDVGSKVFLFSSGSEEWAVVDLSKD